VVMVLPLILQLVVRVRLPPSFTSERVLQVESVFGDVADVLIVGVVAAERHG
jgi:hypothetical protein